VSRSPWLARLAGDPLRAADLYYQQGRLRQAADMYRRAGRYDQAARVQLEIGDRAAALALLLEGGDHLRAGELLAQDGDHREALPHFEAARAWVRAAESALELKQPERAARYYEKAGVLMRAAACFEKAGELAEALRVLEREARNLTGRVRHSGDDSLKDQLRGLEAQRANLLARIGRTAEAADLLLVQGAVGRAAELLERSGDTTRAARAWLQARQPERALPLLAQSSGFTAAERGDVYRQCQRYVEAAAEYLAADRRAEAAECLESAGDWAAAAPLWEGTGELERAAEIYSRAERWREAARCFSSCRRPELAAEAFERAGDLSSAAACFLEAGHPLRAAEGFLAAGDRTGAARALQSIPEGGEEFDAATLLLAPLLVDDGLFEGALHRLQRLPAEAAVGDGGAERQYWMARAFEGQGQLVDALRTYERTVALRRDHRDSAERLEALRKLVDSGALPAGLSGTQRIDVAALSASGPQELRSGVILAGRYKLLGELGRGGMGRVYKAEDQELGDVVALKTLHSGIMDSSDEDRLLREVQICRRITHPNVVRVYDIGRFPGGLFVTMEYLQGETLDAVLRERGPLPLDVARDWLTQLLGGLQEAHQLRIVHRDLKPSNVVLTGERLKILDFGIARMEGGDGSLTVPGEVLGSPKYMSPEQIQGEELDGRTDLYSLGILAYAMVAGCEPFTGSSASAIALKQLHDPPPDVLRHRPELPGPWQDLLGRLLAKAPADRYASAAQALEAVRALPV
jgi:tetratricopeptide (TPR) repeat protein